MKTAIVGKAFPKEGVNRLQSEGYAVLTLPTHPHLDGPIANHPDTLFFFHGHTLITSEKYAQCAADILDALQGRHSIRILTDPVDLASPYPRDVRFNARVASGYLFGRLSSLSQTLLAYASEVGLIPCDTPQGYAACASFTLDGRILSSDVGLLATAQKNGVPTLWIKEGGILLPPYPYGFIGGAIAVTEDTVYTCGDLDTHPDGAAIRELISGSGRRIVRLFDGPLLDVGGLCLLAE